MKKVPLVYWSFALSGVLLVWCVVLTLQVSSVRSYVNRNAESAALGLEATAIVLDELKKESDYNAEWRHIANAKLLKVP